MVVEFGSVRPVKPVQSAQRGSRESAGRRARVIVGKSSPIGFSERKRVPVKALADAPANIGCDARPDSHRIAAIDQNAVLSHGVKRSRHPRVGTRFHQHGSRDAGSVHDLVLFQHQNRSAIGFVQRFELLIHFDRNLRVGRIQRLDKGIGSDGNDCS